MPVPGIPAEQDLFAREMQDNNGRYWRKNCIRGYQPDEKGK